MNSTYVTGQRLRIVDGPLAGKSATVIHHDPDPDARFPIEARTGRVGTVTNLFAMHEAVAEVIRDEHKAVRMDIPPGLLARKLHRIAASTPATMIADR